MDRQCRTLRNLLQSHVINGAGPKCNMKWNLTLKTRQHRELTALGETIRIDFRIE